MREKLYHINYDLCMFYFLCVKLFSWQRDNSIITTTTVTIGANGAPVAAETEVKTVKTLNKSFSEPALDKHMPAPSRDAGRFLLPSPSIPKSDILTQLPFCLSFIYEYISLSLYVLVWSLHLDFLNQRLFENCSSIHCEKLHS